MKYYILPVIVLFLISCQKSGTGSQAGDSISIRPPFQITLKHTLPLLLKESSGLCYTDGRLWTFGDSGNPNAIYQIDTTTGEILHTVVISNFPNIDWEDIAADSQYIYIGDFGNNEGNRQDLKIIRIRKSGFSSANVEDTVAGEAIHFRYADQVDFTSASNTNFDCEALISIGDYLYIFSKDGIDFQTRCYKIPKAPADYTISPIKSFNSGGKITAAAYDQITGQVILLGYLKNHAESFLWFLDEYTGDDFFSGHTKKITIGSAGEWQTEGIDYISAGRFFLSCESTPANPASLFTIEMN